MSDSVQVPDSTIWGGIIAGFTFAFGWLLRLERWRGKVLTRSEHEEICEKRNEDIKEELNVIKSMLHEQNQESREYRDETRNALHAVGLKVAVIQTRMGNPPTGETGSQRKL